MSWRRSGSRLVPDPELLEAERAVGEQHGTPLVGHARPAACAVHGLGERLRGVEPLPGLEQLPPALARRVRLRRQQLLRPGLAVARPTRPPAAVHRAPYRYLPRRRARPPQVQHVCEASHQPRARRLKRQAHFGVIVHEQLPHVGHTRDARAVHADNHLPQPHPARRGSASAESHRISARFQGGLAPSSVGSAALLDHRDYRHWREALVLKSEPERHAHAPPLAPLAPGGACWVGSGRQMVDKATTGSVCLYG